MAGAVAVIRTHTGAFIPPPAVIREAARPKPRFDVDNVLRRIIKLADEAKTETWQIPGVRRVREHLGDLVADAYAEVGSDDLFSGNDTARSIARRDFRKALEAGARFVEPTALPSWAVVGRIAPPDRKRLGDGQGQV
jgi:hypothetical protein